MDCRIIVLLAIAIAIPLVGCDRPSSEVVDTELAPVVDWLSTDEETIAPLSAHNATVGQPPVSSMIAGLEAKLADNPDDLKGWTLLAQSYAHVGQMSDARKAAEQAVRLGANESSLQAKIDRAHTGMMQ